MRGQRSQAPREVTLRDVAAVAGVSVWTASTTYSNPDRVAPATRQRVHAAARELGYVGPHPVARLLARGRSSMIALSVPGHTDVLLGDPAASQVARGLLAACDRYGYALVLSGTDMGLPVDGHVYFRTAGGGDPRLPRLVVDGPPADGVLAVNADVRGAAALVAAHLSDLGHRHLAVLSWPGAGPRLDGVGDGWRARRAPRVFSVATDAGEGGWPTPAAGEALARAALTRTPRPTAVLALTDTLATSALNMAHWLGLRVPGDVSIAGVDDLPGSDARGLTTALVPYRPLGELAGDIVTSVLDGGAPPAPAVLPAALSIRATTGPPPGDGAGRREGGGA